MTPENLYDRICKLSDDAEALLEEAGETDTPTVARACCCSWLAAAATLLQNLRALGVPSDDENGDELVDVGSWVRPPEQKEPG